MRFSTSAHVRIALTPLEQVCRASLCFLLLHIEIAVMNSMRAWQALAAIGWDPSLGMFTAEFVCFHGCWASPMPGCTSTHLQRQAQQPRHETYCAAIVSTPSSNFLSGVVFVAVGFQFHMGAPVHFNGPRKVMVVLIFFLVKRPLSQMPPTHFELVI